LDTIHKQIDDKIKESFIIIDKYGEENKVLDYINEDRAREDKVKDLIDRLLKSNKIFNNFSIDTIYKLCDKVFLM
jgi:hypothetical protein